jgi:hypothetical protein
MFPAVMIDVGWPWWVTTLTAAVVVAVAALVALLTERAELRGAMAPVVVFGVAAAVAAPFVMSDSATTSGGMLGMSAAGEQSSETKGTPGESKVPPEATALPFTFFFTRYEFLGDPDSPHTVRYHSDGAVLTKSGDGSSITMTGRGSWDPYTGEAAGGGSFVMKNPAGATTTKGRWRATRFISFHQVAGFWGFPIMEELWQGPRGSPTFSGFLKLRVELDGVGNALLTAWCAMPEAVKAMNRDDDGITLVGPGFRFTNWKANQKGPWGGLMFYGPGRSR